MKFIFIISLVLYVVVCWGQIIPHQYNSPGDSIVAMEYFIDEDPGFGNGVPLVINQASMVSLDTFIDLSAMDAGVHTLHVRIRDGDGLWSLVQSNTFYIETQKFFGDQSIPGADIVQIEYFINEDPGYGNGISLGVVLNDSVAIDSMINISGLAPGEHTSHIRARDGDGLWSLMQTNIFWVDDDAFFQQRPKPLGDIVHVEYFIDDDPGFGNGIPLDVIPDDSVAIDSLIDISGLAAGEHTLHVRAKDSDGFWSLMQSNTFWVDIDAFFQQRPKPIRDLVQIEYFIDQDPGFGMGFSIPGTDSFLLYSSEEFCVNSIDSGQHYLHARALDGDGYWSLMQVDTFIINEVKIPAVFVGNKIVYLDTLGVFYFDDLAILIDSIEDLCLFDSLWITGDTFDCSDVDTPRAVIFMGMDMHGAIVNDTFMVTVMDSFNVCCPNNLTINDAVIPNGIYEASISISADGLVPQLGVVTFKAGQYVDLLPFFEVELGGDFHAIIEDPCGN